MKTSTRLAVLLFATTLQAQIQDDLDVAIDPFGIGSHGLRMTQTDDGRIVGAWVIHDAGKTRDSDEIAIGVSRDGGRSWKLLWDGRSNVYHRTRVSDMSIAVTPVVGRGAPIEPRVYLVAEFVEYDANMTRPVRRYLECFDGPLERPWSGYRLEGRHVHGQFAHQANVSTFMPSTRPSIGLPVYSDGGQYKHMVVIAYRWWDAPSAGLYLSTPYSGDRGRMRNGTRVLVELLGPDGAFASVATDPAGRTFFVAHELGKDIVAHEIDAELFRRGKPGILSIETVGTNVQRPRIALRDSIAVVTALELRHNSDGSQPLRWYRKRRSAAWNFEGHLSNSAQSPAPVVIGETRMFAAAHCIVDPGVRSVWALVAFTARINTGLPTVQATRVGDTPSLGGLPSLAMTPWADRCAYGYCDVDLWWFGGTIPEVHVDPVR